MASRDTDQLSHFVADYKAQASAITVAGRMAIVVVEATFNCVDLIRGEVVPGLYLKCHIVRPGPPPPSICGLIYLTQASAEGAGLGRPVACWKT